jgi:hypothetical protein
MDEPLVYTLAWSLSMLHSSRNHHRISLILCLLFTASISAGETPKITSNPAGATVELDGVPAGSTPFEKEPPGGYFHRTRTVLGQRLEHPMVARISLAGYPGNRADRRP